MNKIAVVFNTFDDAMNAHRTMFEMLIQNGVVTYGNFVAVASLNNDAYIHVQGPSDEMLIGDFNEGYGWTYLCGTVVDPLDDKWVIVMPEIIKLEEQKRRRY